MKVVNNKEDTPKQKIFKKKKKQKGKECGLPNPLFNKNSKKPFKTGQEVRSNFKKNDRVKNAIVKESSDTNVSKKNSNDQSYSKIIAGGSQSSAVFTKKKSRNRYNPEEEARLERIVFGDPSDIITNLPDDISVEEKHQNTTKESKKKQQTKLQAAWEDEDDYQYTVESALRAQNRKLPGGRPEKSYTELLHNKYKEIVGTPKWAEIEDTENDEFDDLDNDILKHSCHLEVSKTKSLPKTTIEIKKLALINKETHTEGPIVSSLEFHPLSTVALVAGSSGILSIFQVDGIENNKLHTMLYKKFPISGARFLREGTEIILGSQYHEYCHSYNLLSGKTYRIPLPHEITNMKKFEISPDGKLIALCGRMGDIFLLSSSTKELIGHLKMNTKCRAVAFSPNNKTLISHGDGSEMYIWDINSRTCIHRAIDDGCLSCESIAISPNGQFVSTGSKQGVVNIYDINNVLHEKYPAPLKIVLNLVTSITSLKFNPTSEILAMASNEKPNAFKMLHIPSFTVFSNFPSSNTEISMPNAIDFSPGSGYLGITNKSYSAFLFRLKHYGNY